MSTPTRRSVTSAAWAVPVLAVAAPAPALAASPAEPVEYRVTVPYAGGVCTVAGPGYLVRVTVDIRVTPHHRPVNALMSMGNGSVEDITITAPYSDNRWRLQGFISRERRRNLCHVGIQMPGQDDWITVEAPMTQRGEC